MALTVQTTNEVGNFDLAAAGDQFYLFAGALRQGRIRSNFENVDLFIDGTVISDTADTIFLSASNTDINLSSSITIGLTGRVIGLGPASAVAVEGVGSRFVNNGHISATATALLFWNNTDKVGVNNGYMDSSSGIYAVLLGGENTVFTNTGSISALGTGAAVATYLGATTFYNSGIITGSVSYDGDGSFGSSTDTVINRGLMIGDVEMGNLNDLYYGRYGAVEGDIFLGAGDDTASGGAEGERIEGGDGIDRIFGFGGDDNLFGDEGNDVLRGGDGDDGVNGGVGNDDLGGGDGNDVLLGADGNDLLRGDFGADVMNGGDGFDRASYRDSSEAIYFDLADMGQSSGIAQGDSFVSIEAYEATDFDDYMLGDDVNNLLRGMDGDDSLYGRGGNDNLQGFDDDDFLAGGTGNDTLNGGDGTDTAYFEGNQADFTFTLLGNGNIRVEDTVGDNGVDVLVSIELVSFFDASSVDVTGLI